MFTLFTLSATEPLFALTATLVVMVLSHDGTILMRFSLRGRLEFYPKKCLYMQSNKTRFIAKCFHTFTIVE